MTTPVDRKEVGHSAKHNGRTFTVFRKREDALLVTLTDGDNAEVGLRFLAFHSAVEERRFLRLNCCKFKLSPKKNVFGII